MTSSNHHSYQHTRFQTQVYKPLSYNIDTNKLLKEFIYRLSNGSSMDQSHVTTHAKAITTKSSQFHASLRYVNGWSMNPLAITLTADSNV